MAAGTHDLPTLKGYWSANDIALRERLSLYPNDEIRMHVVHERVRDRRALLEALDLEGLKPVGCDGSENSCGDALAVAIHVFLARSNSALVVVQADDRDVAIAVLDRGPGMQAALGADGEPVPTQCGPGLGLVAAQRYVEASGGRLRVAPRDAGGTACTILLPRQPAGAPAPPAGAGRGESSYPEGFSPKPSPTGVSFTGMACGEPKLIEIAYAFEQATKKRVPPGL